VGNEVGLPENPTTGQVAQWALDILIEAGAAAIRGQN